MPVIERLSRSLSLFAESQIYLSTVTVSMLFLFIYACQHISRPAIDFMVPLITTGLPAAAFLIGSYGTFRHKHHLILPALMAAIYTLVVSCGFFINRWTKLLKSGLLGCSNSDWNRDQLRCRLTAGTLIFLFSLLPIYCALTVYLSFVFWTDKRYKKIIYKDKRKDTSPQVIIDDISKSSTAIEE